MPEVTLSFRVVCGGFVSVFIAFMLRRVLKRQTLFIRTLKLCSLQGGVVVGLLLAQLYFGVFLQRCGDVELNPGPGPPATGKGEKQRQTRLSISTAATASSSSSSPSPGGDPTVKDVMDYLQNCKFDEMKDDLKQVKGICAGLQEDVTSLREDIANLKSENQTLKEENKRLCDRVDTLERKVDDLEGRSKRNNIILHGIPRRENESKEDCEGLVKDVLTDKLELPQEVEFDRIHRLNRKRDSPIIACCTFYRDKEAILKARRKLQGTSIFIGEDYSLRVREIRRKLVPHLKAARNASKKASMVFDHLIIDGVKFCLDGDQNLKRMA